MLNIKTIFRYIDDHFFPYVGTWSTLFTVHRYLPSAWTSLTLTKVANGILALTEMKLGRLRVRSAPFVLRIEPCNVCNFHCPQCVCGANLDTRMKGFMKLEDFSRVLDQNIKHAILLRLDGMGEPSLHPGIFEMIRLAKSRGLAVALSSNLDTPAWENMEPWLQCGLDRLVVSIDGLTQESYGRYRIGGNLETVVTRVQRLIKARSAAGLRRPEVEVQFIDFGYNHNEIPEMRLLSKAWGVDRFKVTSAQTACSNTSVNHRHPRRCFWLWTVLTVDWNLNYHACTNSWSLPWPRLNLRDVPSIEFWNHKMMMEARCYNVNKFSDVIAQDPGCKCHRCVEMLSIPLVGDYLCE